MTIRLLLLKSGEDIVADIKEMLVGEGDDAKVVGYFLTKPCTVSLNTKALKVDDDVDRDTYQLKLNGHDRFAARNVHYFTRVQVWEHHSGCSGITPTGTSAAVGNLVDGIAVYSFALKPEEHQPSGTCNFSRIDNAQLVGAGGTTADTCFAVNYNVLRIMSGMGGLAYSN